MTENLSPAPEQKPEEWPIGELYGKAFAIVRKNPVLWWFAIAIGAGAGSSFNSGSGGDISPKDIESLQNIFNEPTRQSAEKVLGAATSPMGDIFTQIMQVIPWYFYAILISEIVILAIGAIVIGLIYRAWAEASLLTGIEDGIAEKKPTMGEMSESAFPLIKSFIWLHVIPGLAFWLVSLSLLGMLIFLLIVVPGNLKVFIGILLAIASIVFLIGLLFLTMTLIWAPRKIVIDKLPAAQAFGIGFHIAKRKFWKTILFGILNNLLSLLVFGVAIGIPVVVFIALGIGAFAAWKGIMPLSIGLIGLIIVLGIIWLVAITILGGMVDSFKAAFWSLAYHKIRGKYEH